MPEEDEQITQLTADLTFWSKVTNSNTRPQSTGSTEMDHFKSDVAGMAESDETSNHEDNELSIVGTKTRTPGDLVEMK